MSTITHTYNRGDHIRSTDWSGVALWFISYSGEDQAVVVMVGDDYEHTVDLESLSPLDEDAFCSSCGQVGCSW